MAMSAVKFLLAAPIALAYGFNYLETLVTTMAGGVIGVIVFFQISKFSIKLINKAKEKVEKTLNGQTELDYEPIPPKKKIFTWKNKLIVKTIRRFGLPGIAFLTPCILSIPVGTFIAFRYFHDKKKVLSYLTLSVVFWAFVLSSLSLLR